MEDLRDRLRQEAGRVLGTITDEEVTALALVYRSNRRIIQNHTFGTLDGGIHLVTAADGPGGPDRAERWRPYVSGPITVAELPYEHIEILDPAMVERLCSATRAGSSTGSHR